MRENQNPQINSFIFLYRSNYSLMFNYATSVGLLTLPAMFSARVKRSSTDAEAVTVDKMMEVRYIYERRADGSLKHCLIFVTCLSEYVTILQGVIDHIEEAGGEVVYTIATGRRVRRRRSVEVVEGVYADHEKHGLVSLEDTRASVVEEVRLSHG